MVLCVHPVQNIVHLVYAHRQRDFAKGSAWMVSMVTSVIRHVPATVINKDVTNRVGDVTVAFRDSMVVIVCLNVNTVSDGSCNKDDGTCSPCKPGFYGNNCELKCDGCLSGACDQDSGACTQGCLLGFHGNKCEETCPQCLYGRCDHSSGECTEGCQSGFHGKRCELQCPDCALGVCDQQTASCLETCPPGESMQFCQEGQSKKCNFLKRCNHINQMSSGASVYLLY